MTITLPRLEMIRITADRLPEVVTVLNEAAARLTARGIEQWPADFEQDGGKRVKALRLRVDRGEVHLLRARDTGEALGTVSLSPIADPDFASGWPTSPEDGLYVYRMATADRAQGMGLGARMLGYASYKALAWGRPYVRLDCSKTNTALHRYYESQGFVHVDTVHTPGRKSGALFERAVA